MAKTAYPALAILSAEFNRTCAAYRRFRDAFRTDDGMAGRAQACELRRALAGLRAAADRIDGEAAPERSDRRSQNLSKT